MAHHAARLSQRAWIAILEFEMPLRNDDALDPEWQADFAASLRRPLRTRFDFSFIRTPQPVVDDQPYRTFETLEEYRRWCREALPRWLGYD